MANTYSSNLVLQAVFAVKQECGVAQIGAIKLQGVLSNPSMKQVCKAIIVNGGKKTMYIDFIRFKTSSLSFWT